MLSFSEYLIRELDLTQAMVLVNAKCFIRSVDFGSKRSVVAI